MIHMQNTKIAQMVAPAAIVDNDDPVGARGDANPVSVDTNGYDYASVYLHIGATDIAVTSSVYEGDSVASGADDSDFTAITGADFGAAAAADEDNGFWVCHIDLRGRKRHLLLECLVGDGTAGAFVTAFCILSRGKEAPTTAAERGLTNEAIV